MTDHHDPHEPAGREHAPDSSGNDHALDGMAAHRHPHPPEDPSGLPRIGIVGAGHAGTALGVAFSRAGWPVAAVASRNPERRARFTELVPSAQGVTRGQQLVDGVDLVFVTVPDDAVAQVAAAIKLYAGQSIVHTSGALPASALDPARAAGTTAASFHPLVAFADVERSVEALHGATIALEGDESLLSLLSQLAHDLGSEPVRLPPGGKSAYHAAAVMAAGGFIGLLDAIAELGRGIGLDEEDALAIYAPLIRQSLANAQELGIGNALTGPLIRGDVGTVRGHLDAMRRLAPGALELYVAAARREVAIARARGALDEGRAAELDEVLLG
jgi:predicted short-subunit dehydrogenase-like oxidoreductase (DUF2520 family)